MLIKGVNIIDIIDILFVAILIYALLKRFKKTKSASVFGGFIVVSIVYTMMRILKLRLTVTIMHSFFAIFLVAFIIIFQEEIRRVFEQIAMFNFSSMFKRKQTPSGIKKQIKLISDTIFDLAREKVGALIVLPAKESIRRYIQGGIALQGYLSTALLKSIFDTHSEGHDGAVIIERGRITQFTCHLPLSKNISVLEKGGTRHAAALGLSEVSDALCLVASEERGTVSFCRFGKIEKIDDQEKLADLLKKFYEELYPPKKSHRSVLSYFTINLKEKVAAIVIAVALWFVVVHESVIVYKSYTVPIQHIGLSDQFYIDNIKPAEIKIILSAPRRNFYFVNKDDIRLELNLFFISGPQDRNEWEYEAIATGSDVRLPEDLTIVNIFPRNISLNIRKKTQPENTTP